MSRTTNLLSASVFLITAGCSTPADGRYLTLEEDQAVREKCEPYEQHGGCVVIPAPLFHEILKMLKHRYV